MMNKLENFDFENSSKEMLRTIDVHDLLPQQEPFVMIGSLVHLDKILTVTETEVQADNIFVDQNHFSASCAARIGYINKYILKKGIQLGFIGAVRNFEVISLPEVGDVITTRVEVKEEVFGMTLAEAVIMCGNKVLVTSDMKIAVKQQHEA